MTSVKERIAALQKKQNQHSDAATPSTLGSSNRSISEATAEKIIMPISSRHNFAKQQIIMTSQNTRTNCNVNLDDGKKEITFSKMKVSALADNMKGLNMQAILGGHQLQQVLSKKRQDRGTASMITTANDMIVEKPVRFQRAVIARGMRRGRTIPDSLAGIKLSTE
jgi:hypothetical protein